MNGRSDKEAHVSRAELKPSHQQLDRTPLRTVLKVVTPITVNKVSRCFASDSGSAALMAIAAEAPQIPTAPPVNKPKSLPQPSKRDQQHTKGQCHSTLHTDGHHRRPTEQGNITNAQPEPQQRHPKPEARARCPHQASRKTIRLTEKVTR